MKAIVYLIILVFIFGCTPKSDRIVPIVPIDSHLKSDAQKFMNTKLTFDFERGAIFAHPISWEITKLKFPEEQDIDAIKKKLKEIYLSAGLEQMNADYNMKITVGNILDSISYQNDEYIYLMDYERKGENKFDKIYAKSIIVGITKDNGGSWKFIDIDKDYLPQTKELLSAIYPANIVDRIFKSIDTGLNISKEEIGFTPTDDIEINLQKQFNSYMNAFYYGNEDEVLNFIYPGVFENLKDVLQEEHSLNELKSIFKESYINIRREQVGNKKYEMRVSKILNKVEYENSLIYALSYYLKSGNQNDYLSVGGELIAISTDNGRSWKFFERDQESAIPILAKKFPDQIITKALNYEYEK